MSAPEAVARLRRLVGELPALGDDGAWLAAQVHAWLDAGDGVTFDLICGLVPPPGRESWRTVERRRERDALIRDLARHFPAASRRGTAHAVALAVRDYQSRAWPRDRRLAAMPQDYDGTAKASLYNLFALGEPVPTGWRRLLDIIAVDDPEVCSDHRLFIAREPVDTDAG